MSEHLSNCLSTLIEAYDLPFDLGNFNLDQIYFFNNLLGQHWVEEVHLALEILHDLVGFIIFVG